MSYFLFNLLLLPFYPAIALYTLWRRFGQKKSSASFQGQWGNTPREVIEALSSRSASTPVIWIQAVSVGEQMAARPMMRALKSQIPHAKIALSCTTDTGFSTAQNALKAGDADAVFYFPLDLPFAVSRVLNAIRPDVFIAVETELWPNFLHLAHQRGVLCMLANGRVSDNLLKRAVKTKWLWKWMISNLDALLMRAEFDAERMHQIAREVGAETVNDDSQNKIVVTGDVKLDGARELSHRDEWRAKWRDELKIAHEELLLVFGSTHSGEEEIALRVFEKLRAKFPNLRLLLAPRHIERTGEVLALIQVQNFSVARRSENSDGKPAVILLDTIGELSEIYAAADVAFVGGSLIPRGGHNVLEPILRGVPVVFGNYMANFRASSELVQNASLGDKVEDENQLEIKLESWLRDDARREELPNLAASTLAPHQGAPNRIAAYIAEQLKLKLKNQSLKI